MNGLLKEKKTVVVLGAVGAVVLLAAAWFLVVAPQQSKADDLGAQVTAAQNELSQRMTELATPAAKITVKAADTYRLAKALPDTTNMAGMILDLNRLAARHKLAFTSITPAPAMAARGTLPSPSVWKCRAGSRTSPRSSVSFAALVRVRGGRLDARGRIYSTTNINLTEAETKFPNVKAAVTIESYTFFAPTAAGTPATPPTSSTPSASATVAAGANP